MKLISQKRITRTRRNITSFGGLDRTARAGGTKLGDMMNMSGEDVPSLTSRPPRGIWTCADSSDGVTVSGKKVYLNDEISAAAAVNGRLCLVSKNGVIADGVPMSGAQPNGKEVTRTVVPFGRGFFIAPDGLFAEKNASDVGYTAKKVGLTYFSQTATDITAVDSHGETVTSAACETLPESGSEGDVAVLTSSDEAYEYTFTNGAWVKGRRVYPSFTADGIGDGFRVNDKVLLKNVYTYDERRTYRVIDVSDGMLTVDAPYKGNKTKLRASIERYCPTLDFAVESNNRIWGCRYGKNIFGEFVNEIYACSLGDALSWDAFDGISSDSYAVSLGCPGEFTGAAVLDGRPVFFKEDKIITVTGTVPQNFSVSATTADGTECGAYKSVVNLNGRLFYKSRNGITEYDGISAKCVSEVFGSAAYTAGASGAVDGKYRTVLTDKNGGTAQYVYDTETDMWHIEDDRENAEFFVNIDGFLCAVCRISTAKNGTDVTNTYGFYAHDIRSTENGRSIFSDEQNGGFVFLPEADSEFFAETREITSSSGSDAVRSIVIRAEKEKDAVLRVGIACGDGESREIFCSAADVNGVFSVPVNTPRCASFKLRFSGRGRVKILSVGIITEKTGEVNAFGR